MVASLAQAKRWKTHTHTCTIPNQRFVTDSTAFSPSFTLNIFRFHSRKEFSQKLLTVGAQGPEEDGREGQEENVERAPHTQRSLSGPGPGPGPAELRWCFQLRPSKHKLLHLISFLAFNGHHHLIPSHPTPPSLISG